MDTHDSAQDQLSALSLTFLVPELVGRNLMLMPVFCHGHDVRLAEEALAIEVAEYSVRAATCLTGIIFFRTVLKSFWTCNILYDAQSAQEVLV